MNERNDALPAEALKIIDGKCDAFELAWQFGQRPKIEDYLTDCDPKLKECLFRQLVELDVEYRCRNGESVALADYQPLGELKDETFSQLVAEFETHQTDPPNSQTQSAATNSRDLLGESGRFRIYDLISEGGFGAVYTGFDQQLQRRVAIKIAHLKRTARHGDMQLLEARISAGLDHPAIVPVYDVGRLPGGRLYIVSKLIDGTDLRSRLKEFRYSPKEAADLLLPIGEALHHAHGKGIVHRDVKPANILLDGTHRAFLTDFGIALREETAGQGAQFVGSPPYMSPEQARKEGHLVDGRSDVFGLSVVFYQMLTGRRPFTGTTTEELLDNIRHQAPAPPSIIEPKIPPELERIVLKGLSKRAGDRYQSADLWAEDVRAWLQNVNSTAKLQSDSNVDSTVTAVAVPKGLRAFDETDKEFFYRLVPGPKNREGVPEALEFWQHRMESTVSHASFRVGVLYGPSGSGKTSLLRAGILPRLSANVTTCYVAATPGTTERLLVTELRRQCPGLTIETDLTEAIRRLRSGEVIQRDQIFVLIIDQFEQFLGEDASQQTELASALRQCDGIHVKALLIVRDDFWYRLTRFLELLDVQLGPDNGRLAELFHEDHARHVLRELGRGHNRVDAEPTKSQEQFINLVTQQLSQTGSIVPVRLALLVDVLKNRPWTPATLQKAGGVDGVFSMFLDGILSGDQPHPLLSRNVEPLLALLQALIPPSGSSLKAGPKTAQELASATRQPMSVICPILDALDRDCRLVTRQEGEGGTHYFQLAHDYLVPIIREWVSRKRRSTFRGWAENLLDERTSVWSAAQQHRNLPSLWEWIAVRIWTHRSRWSPAAAAMMQAAGRRFATGALATIGTVMLILALANNWWKNRRADAFCDRILDAATLEVPQILEEAEEVKGRLVNRLVSAWNDQHQSEDPSPRSITNLALALASQGRTYAEFLIEKRVRSLAPDQLPVVGKSLAQVPNISRGVLWDRAATGDVDGDELLRLATVLAVVDPNAPQWELISTKLAKAFVDAQPRQIDDWLANMQPVQEHLYSSMTEMCNQPNALTPVQRQNLGWMYAAYCHDQSEMLSDMLRVADKQQLAAVLPVAIETLTPKLLRQAVEAPQRTLQVEEPAPAHLGDEFDPSTGFIDDRVAVSFELRRDVADRLVQSLASTGYRLASFRPYSTGTEMRVAAAWVRDGRKCDVEYDLTTAEMNEMLANRSGVEVVDFTEYRLGDQFRYAIVTTPSDDPTSSLIGYLEVPIGDHFRRTSLLRNQNCKPVRLTLRNRAEEEPLVSALWTPVGGEVELEPVWNYLGKYRDGWIGTPHSDVQLSSIDLGRRDMFIPNYFVSKRTWEGSRNNKYGFSYLIYNAHLGQHKEAIYGAKEKLAEKPVVGPNWERVLTTVWRFSKQHEKLAHQISSRDKAGDAIELSLLKMDHAICEDDESAALLHYEEYRSNTPPDAPAKAIRQRVQVLSRLSEFLASKSNALAEPLRSEALGLILDGAFTNPDVLLYHRDCDSLRTSRRFREYLRGRGCSLRVAVLHDGQPERSKLLIRKPMAEQLAESRGLAADGYFPQSIAARHVDGIRQTAIIWRKPKTSLEVERTRSAHPANVAIALALLGDWELFERVANNEFGPQARSYLVDRLPAVISSPAPLLELLARDCSSTCKQTIVLTIGRIPKTKFLPEHRGQLSELMSRFDAADAGVVSAVAHCRRQLNLDRPATETKATGTMIDSINSLGQRMIVVDPPGSLLMGSSYTEADRDEDEQQHVRSFAGRFAMSETEVTRGQFQRFLSDPEVNDFYTKTQRFHSASKVDFDDGPQGSVTYLDAIRFCQWLNEKETIPKSEWCYQGVWNVDYEPEVLDNSRRRRTGYRLPFEAEWEYACRAGSRRSSRHFGWDDSLLSNYAWGTSNSMGRHHPVASLMPNDLGFFDMLGGVAEWCESTQLQFGKAIGEDEERQTHRIIRGGSIISGPSELRSAERSKLEVGYKNFRIGFRVVRTLAAN